MKLQNKFLVLLAPAGAAAGGLILYLIKGAANEVIVGGAERASATIARAAALEAGRPMARGGEKDLLPVVQAFQRREGALYAAALGLDGRVLAHTTVTEKGRVEFDARTAEALRSDEPSTWLGAEREEPVLYVVAPVRAPGAADGAEAFLLTGEQPVPRGARLGALKAAVPLGPALETERRIVREISAIVVAIGGVAFGLVLILVRGILAPIRGLLSGISSIGVGDYDVRVPVLSRDELGELAESFNAMSGQLARTTVSKEYVEGVLENMRDLLLVTDRAGRVKTANHAAAEALGGGVVGRPFAEVLAYGDGFSEPKAARDAEVALRARDGGRIPVLLSSAPLHDREGRRQGWIVVAKDITDRKRDEEALVRAKLAAEASSRELEAFSYSVAHDLRAPLRAVDGFSQILLDSYHDKLDDQGRDYLNRVRAGSRRMGRLIDDLLNLSRITRSALKLEDVDLSALAEEIAAELKRGAPKRRVEFVVEPGVVVRGDPSLLRVALVNLLSNAWKYTGKNESARVEFGRRPGPVTRLFVRDDGAGFDMAFANKLFHPFSRLHSAAEFEGTGIGLAIVQRVVSRHRGVIRGEGAPGRGATFEFTLWEENA